MFDTRQRYQYTVGMMVDSTQVKFTVQELAELAGVTDGYIRRLLINGDLRGDKFGTQWAIPRREVERFLKQRGRELE